MLGVQPLGHGGEHPRAQAGDAVPGGELDDVTPVHPDVAEGAGAAAERRLEPPVPVAGTRQPVLQVRPVQQAQGPDVPAAHPSPRVAHRGIEAVHERHGGDDGSRGRQGGEAPRGVHARRQRLLADHMLAGRHRALGQRRVQVVRRADVDDIDVVGFDEFLR